MREHAHLDKACIRTSTDFLLCNRHSLNQGRSAQIQRMHPNQSKNLGMMRYPQKKTQKRRTEMINRPNKVLTIEDRLTSKGYILFMRKWTKRSNTTFNIDDRLRSKRGYPKLIKTAKAWCNRRSAEKKNKTKEEQKRSKRSAPYLGRDDALPRFFHGEENKEDMCEWWGGLGTVFIVLAVDGG